MSQSAQAASPGVASSPTDITFPGWKRIGIAAWKDAGEDNLSLIAAGVAFYAFLALVPMLTALVLSYGLIAEPASVVGHMQKLTSVMPASAADIIGDQLTGMTETAGTKTGFALMLAIAIALYGASKGAGAIVTALNIAYEVSEDRSIIIRTALSLAMTAGVIIVLVSGILAISAMNFVARLLPSSGGVVHLLLQILAFVLAGVAVVMLLAIIYRHGPNRPNAPWRWITPGSALAAIVWIAATFGFGLYASNFSDYNATYGSLGAVIVFITWLYLSAYIILFGAELNSIIELEGKRQACVDRLPETSPAPPAEPVAGTISLGALVGRLSGFYLLASLLGGGRRSAAGR